MTEGSLDLRSRSFSAIKQVPFARAASEVGNALRYIALPLGIIAVRGKAQDLAFAEILETLGFFASGLIAPFFIDRTPKLKALVISDFFSLLVSATMAYGIYIHSLFVLFAASFAMTFTDTFYSSSLSAVTADLTEQTEGAATRNLVQGFSRLQFFTLIGGLIGSLAGSALLKAVPIWSLLVLDAASFLASSVWIYLLVKAITSDELRAPHRGSNPVVKTFRETIKRAVTEWKTGWVAATGNRVALKYILSQGIIGISHGILSASVIGHYKKALNASNSQVALAQFNNRVWQIAGSYLSFRTNLAARPLILRGSLLLFIGYLSMTVLPFYGFLIAYGIQQLGNALLTPANRSLCLSGSTSENRGRVTAIRGLIIDLGTLLGNLLTLLLIDLVGTRMMLGLAALFVIGSMILFIKRAGDG